MTGRVLGIIPDSHMPSQRNYNMSHILSSSTAPEKWLGEMLRVMFPESEIISQNAGLPGKPDWYLPEIGIAAFADGCFFHRCPRHFILPERNQEYWIKKIRGNKKRDQKNNATRKAMRILPVRIWEHNLKRDSTNAHRQIRSALRRRRILIGGLPSVNSLSFSPYAANMKIWMLLQLTHSLLILSRSTVHSLRKETNRNERRTSH